MPTAPKRSERDPEDDAKARAWARETRRRGEAGELQDDSEHLQRKLAEEKRKLER